MDKTNEQLNKLNGKIQKITTDIAKTVGYLEELNTEKNDIEIKLNEAEKDLKTNKLKKEELEQTTQELNIVRNLVLSDPTITECLENQGN